MIRIGIIGTESSHAGAFSQIINCPRSDFADMHVAALYGPDRATAEAVADVCGGACIADSLQKLTAQVDAVMITARKRSLHYAYALPLIEQKMPLFIDKPLTCSVEQAEKLLERARLLGVPILGGSGCKLSEELRALSAKVAAMRKTGELISASMCYAADPDSPYDGFWFYGSHLVEMALEVFGYEVKSVGAVQNGKTITALLRYADLDITLVFSPGVQVPSCTVFSKKETILTEIPVGPIYRNTVEAFAAMLRTGRMPFSYGKLLAPVKVIDGILQALQQNAQIRIHVV